MAKGSRLPCKEGGRVGVIPRACTFLSMGTGEPDTSKVVCPVRRGTGRKGSHDLARGLPYLRFRFRQQVSASVDMTSDVKSGQQIFLGLHDVFFPRCIERAGASTMRRLILLISVGWVPPYLRPSGACLCLGSSVLYKPHNAAEGYTTPGLRLFRCTSANLSEFNDAE